MTTDELVNNQSEIKTLSDDFKAYYADWQGAKHSYAWLQADSWSKSYADCLHPRREMEIWEARQIKKVQYRKEKFLKNNVVSMTTDDLVKIQSEIKVLGDDFNAYYADWQGAKVRFVKLTEKFISNVAAPSQ